MDRQRFLISALVLLTVSRLALLPTVELCPDEALAVLHGQRWQWWYLEMGPLVPWLAALGQMMFGHSELAVRCWAPLLMFGASLCVFRLARGVFDETLAAWAVLFMQVLPGVNFAATTLTTGGVGLACLCGYVLSLRVALHRASQFHAAWLWAAGCLLAAMLTDWRNGLAYACTVLALSAQPRRRHHLYEPGFFAISGAFLLAALMFLGWNWAYDWPLLEAGEAEPVWSLLPNLLRWMLLASPVLLTLLVWGTWRAMRIWLALPDHDLLLAFALPFALLDLGWGPQERWPHPGWPLWMVLGCVMLTHQMMGRILLPMPGKILLRTTAVFVAGLQSMLLMRTDMLRSVSVAWPFQQMQGNTSRTYTGFFRADPSSSMIGWQQSANVVQHASELVLKGQRAPWFIIARDWRLAAGIDFYLPEGTPAVQLTAKHPRVNVMQGPERDNPYALWPRYDEAPGSAAGHALQHALYVTDDAKAQQPPSGIRNAFKRCELLSETIATHGGWPVRTIKVFACYYYQPPEF